MKILHLFLLLVTSYCFSQSLGGEYLIGTDNNDDFSSISLAVESLVENGISSDVVFKIKHGTYLAQEIDIPAIEGTSNNYITFEPFNTEINSVILQSNTYLFKLINNQNFIFKNLTLELLDISYYRSFGFWLRGTENTQISGCVFKAPSPIYSDDAIFIHFDPGHIYFDEIGFESNNILIKNNTFVSGYKALSISGDSSLNIEHNNILIEHNNFEGTSSTNIAIDRAKNITIKGNYFTGQRIDAAIILKNLENDIELSNNRFELAEYLQTPLSILDCPITISNPMIIKNNFFNCKSYTSIIRSSNIKILNNSFNADNSENNWHILRLDQNLINIDVYNNIFKTDNNKLIYLGDTILFENINFNNNVYHSSDELIFTKSTLDYNFHQWQEFSKMDSNSFSIFPNYTSTSDLHLNNDIVIDGKGKVLPEVIFDIDGEFRDLNTPDIGADEFSIDYTTFIDVEIEGIVFPNNNPCEQLDDINISVKNNSEITINSFDIEWWLFDNSKGINTINEIIEPSESVIINIGNYLFTANTTYFLSLEASNPNSVYDNNPANNIYNNNYNYIDEVKILKETDIHCSEEHTLYVKTIHGSDIIWSTGDTSKYIKVSNPGTYSVSIVSSNGCSKTGNITIQ